MLIDRLLERINEQCKGEPGFRHKKISPRATNLLLRYDWPGNVRELENTLRRLVVFSSEERIRAEDVEEAILPPVRKPTTEILHRPLGKELKINNLLDEVRIHYLKRAMTEAHGVKKVAAELVGLDNYQTLTNWLKKYGLDG